MAQTRQSHNRSIVSCPCQYYVLNHTPYYLIRWLEPSWQLVISTDVVRNLMLILKVRLYRQSRMLLWRWSKVYRLMKLICMFSGLHLLPTLRLKALLSCRTMCAGTKIVMGLSGSTLWGLTLTYSWLNTFILKISFRVMSTSSKFEHGISGDGVTGRPSLGSSRVLGLLTLQNQ